MVQDENTERWNLLGIFTHNFDEECYPNDYSAFVDIKKFFNWIHSNSGLFKCFKNQNIISISKVCDGIADCEDGSDESHCGEYLILTDII